jgi:hypothetical protein
MSDRDPPQVVPGRVDWSPDFESATKSPPAIRISEMADQLKKLLADKDAEIEKLNAEVEKLKKKLVVMVKGPEMCVPWRLWLDYESDRPAEDYAPSPCGACRSCIRREHKGL